jgi:hypothetical protein
MLVTSQESAAYRAVYDNWDKFSRLSKPILYVLDLIPLCDSTKTPLSFSEYSEEIHFRNPFEDDGTVHFAYELLHLKGNSQNNQALDDNRRQQLLSWQRQTLPHVIAPTGRVATSFVKHCAASDIGANLPVVCRDNGKDFWMQDTLWKGVHDIAKFNGVFDIYCVNARALLNTFTQLKDKQQTFANKEGELKKTLQQHHREFQEFCTEHGIDDDRTTEYGLEPETVLGSVEHSGTGGVCHIF